MGVPPASPPLVIFSPNPIVTVTVEAGTDGGDEIHLHPGGQGVWVARMAAELGAAPVLCGFSGGEAGHLLEPLLAGLPGQRRFVPATASTGVYITDRRSGERRLVAAAAPPSPSRHEVDALVSATLAAAVTAPVLSVCMPYPTEGFPPEPYAELVADAGAGGAEVHVDLSVPHLLRALEGRPALVKVNDWQLAEFVVGPVDTPELLRDAAKRLCAAGAERVCVTRAAEPSLVLTGEDAFWLTGPSYPVGAREGCGDTMMGAIGAARARGLDWPEALRTGTAAGAANFLRRGLGTGSRTDVEAILDAVTLTPF